MIGRLRNDDRGLTLVEMLVTVAILALMAGLIVSYQWTTLTWHRSTDQQLEVQQSVRLGMSRMTRVARAANLVVVEGPNNLLFHHNNKTTRYYLNNGILYEVTTGSGAGTSQVALSITTFTQHWDAEKKMVTFYLEGQSPNGEKFKIETRVAPRNVK